MCLDFITPAEPGKDNLCQRPVYIRFSPFQSVAIVTLREITPLYILENVFGFYNACGAGARQRKALSCPQAPYLCTGAAQKWGTMVIRFLARG